MDKLYSRTFWRIKAGSVSGVRCCDTVTVCSRCSETCENYKRRHNRLELRACWYREGMFDECIGITHFDVFEEALDAFEAMEAVWKLSGRHVDEILKETLEQNGAVLNIAYVP